MNTLTLKRHQKVLSDMIVDTMRNESCSLLEAYVKLQNLVSSEEVVSRAKKKIMYINSK